ncbi:uncharacterized protein C8Q71DRAFT_424643 [Rhodofomes roseus]|uniref:DH domain-containing protein n=1 Tax=Rhodofomes roseus TaxID=34475 RepID=A0ABQ8KQB4_9APHY|nr:uncharacterized protein C8Q71DRAFT_424643 [Rhodofomes roseus]KAH9840814.1 hypothetical protein C8Q71DRAFT_424643 [Rhodofomes roseus]
MSPRVDAGQRCYPEDVHDEEEESVYDDEDDASSEASDIEPSKDFDPRTSYAEDDHTPNAPAQSLRNRHSFTRSRERISDASPDRHNDRRLSGLVDGLQAAYGVRCSPGKSVLSQSESDVYFEQGLAIGTSSDFPNSSGDVSFNVAHREDEPEEDVDGDEERSEYSESEESFSIVVDDEEEEVQVEAGGPWWTRGRRSPKDEGVTSDVAPLAVHKNDRRTSGDSRTSAHLRASSDERASAPDVQTVKSISSAQASSSLSTTRRPQSRASTHADATIKSPRPDSISSTDLRTRRRTMMYGVDNTAECTPRLPSFPLDNFEPPRRLGPSSDESKISKRTTMSFTERFVRRPDSRRSSVLEDDVDRTPRVSSQDNQFFLPAEDDPEEAVILESDDCTERERQAFGIPRSLSFGAGHSGGVSQPTASGAKNRPSALLRSESDESLSGGPSAMTRESSYMAAVWRESAGKDVLSKGAHELFEVLAFRSRDEEADEVERPKERRDRSLSRQSRPRSRSRQREERPSSRQDYQPPNPSGEEARQVSQARPSRRKERQPVSPATCEHAPDNRNSQIVRPQALTHEAILQTSQTNPLPAPSPQGNWRSTFHIDVYDSLLARHGPMEMQRQEIVYELLQTERDFVRRLRAMTSAFIVPLRVHASKTWLPGVPTQVSRLFDWLEDILNLHTSLLRVLKNTSRAWHANKVVGEVASSLLPLIPRLEVHQPYLVRVDEVRGLVVMWAQDQHSQFGEYIRLSEEEGLCDGWSLEQCLQISVHRLTTYLTMFKRLLDTTHRQHPDYLATLSLLRSAQMMIHVMEEVRVREEEYDFVKAIATRILGPDAAAHLAIRERRLLYQGLLHLSSSDAALKVEPQPVAPTVQVNGRPVHHSIDDEQDKAERGRRLATAIHDWHVKRARSESISSSASSSFSLWSHDSLTSNVTPNTPMSDIHPPSLEATTGAVQVLVFTDMVLLVTPSYDDQSGGTQWQLLSGAGLSRILDVRIDTNGRDRAVVLDLIPLDIQELSLSLHSRAGAVVELRLELPHLRGDNEQDWFAALQRSRTTTLHSLSFAPPSPEDVLQGPVGDYEQDTYHCVKSILASGLPMPKSPSMQLDEGNIQQALHDNSEQEREERGWWSLRFHQVLREFQRQQDAGVLLGPTPYVLK